MTMNRQIHAPAALHLEKKHRYPLNGCVGGSQSRYGRCIEERNILSLLGIGPQKRIFSSSSLINIPTEPSQLINLHIYIIFVFDY
jgi:hypothetical protein